MTAAKMAVVGLVRAHDVERLERGVLTADQRWMMAKHFATSLAIENVVRAAARHEQLFADAHEMSMSFCGLESRSTMLPAPFAACAAVRVTAYIGLRERRRVVRAVARHGYLMCPLGPILPDGGQLCPGAPRR